MPRAAVRPDRRRRATGDLAVAIEAALWLTMMRAALAAFPFRRISGWLGLEGATPGPGPASGMAGANPPPGGDAACPAAPVDEASRIGWAVRAAAARAPWANSCLVQALAASRMLGRRGLPHELRLGVAGAGRDFAAHAWLTCGGQVLVGGQGLERFAALAAFVFPGRLR